MIYSPAEDSYLMAEVLGIKLESKGAKILDMGTGSGYIIESLKKWGFENLSGVDVNKEAVELCRKKRLDVCYSDLFSSVDGKFDVIIFNPPYLPKDSREDDESSLVTTGGEKGSEIINRFLSEARGHLSPDGKIFLLTSSLTSGIEWSGYKKKLVGEKKLFFEKLEMWELSL
jgi:release factor glutamine methyltransferase